MKLSLSNWYPGSGVGLVVSIPDLCLLSYFHVFPRDNIRKPFTLCITQSLRQSDRLSFALLDCIILHINFFSVQRFHFCSVYNLHGDH